jgi:hypothetical protein
MTSFSDEILTPKTLSLVLSKIDEDLARNIVFSAVSMNQKTFLDVTQACLIISAQRELEGLKKQSEIEAEEIVEKTMGEFAERLNKSLQK